VGISGGGALQKDIDDFYQAVGIRLLEGYGITEAAPVLSVRNSRKPRSGCVGIVFPSAEIKIVAEKEGVPVSSDPLPVNTLGLIMARGDQIMKGYYRQPELTKQVIDSDGWLNTGDLGMLSAYNEIKITGRAKDTIVLLGGENIEPAVIEAAINGSGFIEFTVVLGQDKKYLAALIVPAKDALTDWARANGLVYSDYPELLTLPETQNLIHNEITARITAENGFRTCERIYRFRLLPESFIPGKELSAKQEMMRHRINDIYKAEINGLFE
ncbi:MAG: AMP-binding protein, partial [Spirochaetaceae bacterium]|nr:AMP-binding protein [Spirochaetaceae bacterium]